MPAKKDENSNNPNAGPKKTKFLSTQMQAQRRKKFYQEEKILATQIKAQRQFRPEEGTNTINPKSSSKMVKIKSTKGLRLIFKRFSAWKLHINWLKGLRCCTSLVTFRKLWIHHLDLHLKLISSSSCNTNYSSAAGSDTPIKNLYPFEVVLVDLKAT